MIFKTRRKIFGRLGYEAKKISSILSDIKGENNEVRAFCIAENYLRIVIREEVDGWKSKLRLKKLENIEFSAGRYGNEPGKDIWLKILFPEDLRGEKVDIEVTSSKDGWREHRKKFSTSVVVVNNKISDEKIARRICNIF